ncbi:MAG: putative Ig domain-containing protein, partial [Gammaproteobacteria bacterium]
PRRFGVMKRACGRFLRAGLACALLLGVAGETWAQSTAEPGATPITRIWSYTGGFALEWDAPRVGTGGPTQSYRLRYTWTECFTLHLRSNSCYLDLRTDPLCGFPCGPDGKMQGIDVGKRLWTNIVGAGTKTYRVDVMAYNASGNGPWSGYVDAISNAPPLPANPSVSLRNSGADIQVTWEPGALPSFLPAEIIALEVAPTGYSVRWRNVTDGEAFQNPAAARAVYVDAGVNTYTITGAQSGEDYAVQVAAHNNGRFSQWNNPPLTVRGGGANADLKSLTLIDAVAKTQFPIRPGFSAGNLSYTASVPFATTSVTVSAESVSTTAAITLAVGPEVSVDRGAVSHTLPLSPGANDIGIFTSSPSGLTQRAYALKVTREVTLTFAMRQTNLFLHGGVAASLILPTVTGGASPYAYTLSALPAGLSFNASTNTISGSPTAVASTTTLTEMTHTATDNNGVTGEQTFEIRVAPAPAFESTAPALLALRLDAVASPVTLPALVGGYAPRAYTLTGAVPAGLAFAADTRILSGTPSAIADATLTYTAKDALGSSGEASGVVTAEIRIRVLAFDLNVDDAGGITVQDGIMVARYLLGVRGAALIDGQSIGNATTIGGNIQDGVDLAALDVDADSDVDWRDGILLARYLLGLRDEVLVAGMDGAVAATVEGNVRALL